MNYEYNGNLFEGERLKLVASEIIEKYPFISFENAIKSAMLEGKISSSPTKFDKILRLYNIMLINRNNKDIVKIIYQDFIMLISKDSKYFDLAMDIHDYIITDCTFPIIEI